ncbi:MULTISPECIES: hypothetical protein [unclassified Streptomyces]|uniref:hypothetical protein n=1 Tax=unclassified Streptomyces TaxID=2593676 RepID=UPI0007C67C8A|nr:MULTISPECIES: hypothetical protein [unclassified Streptomyces]
MTKVKRIADLDTLPAGSIIEILDKRGSVRRKDTAGNWTDAAAKPTGTTWNTWTYVNTRRYGARVIERNEAVTSLPEGIRALIDEYRALETERSEHLDRFRNEDGDVHAADLPRYDEARFDNALFAEENLCNLLSALEELTQKETSK